VDPTFLLAYVLGRFRLGFSVPFNKLAATRLGAATRRYLAAVEPHVILLAEESHTRELVFSSAYSFIRLSNPAALAEIEGQAGGAQAVPQPHPAVSPRRPVTWYFGLVSSSRLHADLFMAALAFYQFQWLYDWTHQLVFDFFLQVHARPAASPQPEPVAPKD
jgi:hypothetical protein